MLHEYPVSKRTGCDDPQGDLTPNYPCQIMQPIPGDPGFCGCLQGKLKTEYVAASQKVLEIFSCHSILKHHHWSTALSVCRPGEFRKEGSWAQAAMNFLDVNKCVKKKFQGFILLSQSFYNSAYPAKSLLIYTVKMRGKPNFSYLFDEIT